MAANAFFLLFSLSVFAQGGIAGGTVTDTQGEPLIGVSVAVKGSTTGVVTDLDGKFSIPAEKGQTLIFTYIGMNAMELPAAASMKVVMKDSNVGLNEIVVIGYGTQRKSDLTTAVSTVSSKEWQERPIISPQQALQGKAAGVQVTQPSGKPGAGLSVRVRGATSINANSDPLYVVDGIPTNDITNIAPNDIETMTILKDASSAAIYGSRAANGVILITTKRGNKDKGQLNVSMYTGFSNLSKSIETLNTKEYYDLMTERGESIDYSNHHYTNWEKETYGTGIQRNYQVSLSGGNEKSDYFISGGYQNETGIIAPADYDRYSVRSNVNAEVKEWLKVSTNLSFARNSKHNATDNQNAGRGGIVMAALNTPPFLSIWDESNPGQYATNPFQSSWENPLAQASNYDLNREYRFMGNVGLDFIFTPKLHFKPSLSVDFTSHTWDMFVDPVKTGYGRNANGRGEHADDDWLTWTSENILSYQTKINESHNLTAIAGATYSKHEHNNAYMAAEDFAKGTTFSVMTLNMANKINTATSLKEGNALISYLGRVQYDYESRYLLTASLRADGSSKLHPDHQWAYFPSVSAGWRFSSESFFETLTSVVNDAKLRVSYGQNGNQNGIYNYDYLDKYRVDKQEKTGNGPAISPSQLGNRDLQWERTAQYNAGLDLSLFGSRLTGEFDVYYKHTTELLLYVNLPATLGRGVPMRNDGEMINKGFEFNLTGYILTGAFKWDSSLNMSFNKNRIEKLNISGRRPAGDLEDKGYVMMEEEGFPLGTFFGYVAQGVDPETGDMMYEDRNGNGILDPGDRTYIGNAQPDFIFGFSHNFSYKNFTLSAFLQGTYGNDTYNATRMDLEGMVDSKNQSKVVLDRWMRPGMITDIPRSGNPNNSLISSRFVEDGSYLRLKTLTLAYNVDKKLTRKFKSEALTVYATASNLFTLTKYRGYDPESNNNSNLHLIGVDMGTFPQTRSFVFGFNLTF
jgi:TonB-linked SusC/RagA family outer membrane protein